MTRISVPKARLGGGRPGGVMGFGGAGFERGSDGSTTLPGMLKMRVRNQLVMANGIIFKTGPNSQYAQNPTETDVLTVPSGDQLLDGGYTFHSSLENQPPVLRGGFMLPTGQEKAMELVFKSTLGINFLASTLTNTSLFQKATVLFTLTPSDASGPEVTIASCDVMASQCSNSPTSTNFPLDFAFTLAPSSVSSGPKWNSRVHISGSLGTNFGGVMPQAKETSPYPIIDWSKDQIIRIKQKWDAGFPAGYIYVDTLTVKWE